MTKMKTATRNAMPAPKFTATRKAGQVKTGRLTPAMATKIRAKANAILGGK